MYNESSDFLENSKSSRITIYMSLAAAHIIFGMLHQESITIAIATAGFAFFATLVFQQVPTQTSRD